MSRVLRCGIRNGYGNCPGSEDLFHRYKRHPGGLEKRSIAWIVFPLPAIIAVVKAGAVSLSTGASRLMNNKLPEDKGLVSFYG